MVPGMRVRLSAECHSYPVPRALFNSQCVCTPNFAAYPSTPTPSTYTLNAFIKQPPDTYLQCYRETTVDLTCHFVGICIYIFFFFWHFFFVRIFSLTTKTYALWSICSIVFGFSDMYMIRNKKFFFFISSEFDGLYDFDILHSFPFWINRPIKYISHIEVGYVYFFFLTYYLNVKLIIILFGIFLEFMVK